MLKIEPYRRMHTLYFINGKLWIHYLPCFRSICFYFVQHLFQYVFNMHVFTGLLELFQDYPIKYERVWHVLLPVYAHLNLSL